MKARELAEHDWFRWEDDWRVFARLPGELKVIDGRECIPVRPLQPTANMPGGYIPADDEAIPYKASSLKLN